MCNKPQYRYKERNIYMRRRLFVCAFIIGLLAVSATGTLAYFTSEDTATNVITAGDIEIELQEMALSEDEETIVPFKNNQIGIMPGTEVSKIVSVKNSGSQSAYVRIKLDKAIVLEDGSSEDVDLSLIEYDINQSDWTEKDGYYYYNLKLLPGETSSPLFTKLIFSEAMDNKYEKSTAKISINAEAAQSANNADSVLEAAGWPENN